MNTMKKTMLKTLASRAGLRWPARASESPEQAPSESYERDASETRIMWGLFAFILAVYVLALAVGVVPGESAVATAAALHLLPDIPVTHPLWLAASRAVAAIPILDAAVRLNLFSALCGSFAAAWLFRITKRIIFEFIREPPSIRLVPVGDDDADDAPSFAHDAARPQNGEFTPEALEHIAATLGGVITSLTFAFSAPFWIASESLHVQPFLILLALMTAERLACYYFTGRTTACLTALLLTGLGLAESVVFVVMLPFILTVILRASIRYQQICESFMLMLMLVGFLGLALNLGLLFLFSAEGQGISSSLLFRSLAGLAHTHKSALMQGLPKAGWLFVLLQTTFPVLMATMSIRRFSALQEESVQWKWGLSNLLFSGVAVACAMNLPQAAWRLAREGSHLPIIPSLSIAIAIGFFFVYWLLISVLPNYNRNMELGSPSLGLRLLGYVMCTLLCVTTLRLFHTNLDDANGRTSSFADLIAKEMLQQAGPAQCLMTDGTLDLNLLIRARVDGRKTSFVSSFADTAATNPAGAQRAAPYRLVMHGNRETPNPASAAFVENWLRATPTAHKQVAVIGSQTLLQNAGLTPIPAGLIYVGVPAGTKIDCAALHARHRLLWQHISPLLSDDPTLRPELRRIQGQLREHASRLANDAGVLEENLGCVQEADAAYCEALRIDSSNLSACLNRYGLNLRNRSLGHSHELYLKAAELSSQPGLIEQFDSAVAHDGTLAGQPADTLLPAVLNDPLQAGEPDDSLLTLCKKWMAACYTQPAKEPAAARDLGAHANSSTPNPQLSLAVAMLRDGQAEKAEGLLRLLVRNQPKNLSAWSMLADILLSRGELKEVSQAILPAMRAAKGNGSSTLIDMTQGCLSMRTSPPDINGARDCFARALAQNPGLTVACDELLRASTLSGCRANLETDALIILKHVPGHATANAILGSFRLAQRQYAESEGFLRQSIEIQPTAGALNDLAEVLRLQGKRAEAEQQARLAIRLKPDFHQAWDTLGNILLEEGRNNEANDALRCALAWCRDDPRLYLTLSRLRLKQGHIQEASHALELSYPLLTVASGPVSEEYAKLRDQLASRRSSTAQLN